MNILLGITGAPSASKSAELIKAIRNAGHEVRVVATDSSKFFFHGNGVIWEKKPSPGELDNKMISTYYEDVDEWPEYHTYENGDKALHLSLAAWADSILIYPLTANTLCDLAIGRSDRLLTSIVIAFDNYGYGPREGSTVLRPLIVVPEMHPVMLDNLVVQDNLAKLTTLYNTTIVYPNSNGSVASIDEVVNTYIK